MSALRSEYEDAVAEGVKFLWRTAAEEFICDDNSGWSTGLKVDTPEGEKVLSFNRILFGHRFASCQSYCIDNNRYRCRSVRDM